jgi:hypothetical protein
MNPDETPLPTPEEPPEAPFEFGDRTLLTLRAQPFAIENEYGTMVLSSIPISRETTEMPMPVVEAPAEPSSEPEDPILRLEQKLDAALRLIHSLQQQLDSMDATLARALNR